jgi:hypothetical protein
VKMFQIVVVEVENRFFCFIPREQFFFPQSVGKIESFVVDVSRVD